MRHIHKRTCWQVPEHDAVVYHVDRVRRPVPEGKAINRAVEMIKVGGKVDSLGF